jgi:hypothetical protein
VLLLLLLLLPPPALPPPLPPRPRHHHAAKMTLKSGKVVDLTQMYKDSKGKCCQPASVLGDASPIVKMEGSRGAYYVTGAGSQGLLLSSSDC